MGIQGVVTCTWMTEADAIMYVHLCVTTVVYVRVLRVRVCRNEFSVINTSMLYVSVYTCVECLCVPRRSIDDPSLFPSSVLPRNPQSLLTLTT